MLALAAAPAVACEAPAPREYAIRHETQGVIGRHRIQFACAGEALIVTTTIAAEVKLLFVPVFQRQASYREEWRGDRLTAFDSRFLDNGETFTVRARADGERTVIEGAAGRIEAPASVVSNHPWNMVALARPLLFDTREGRLQRVTVRVAGEETLQIGAQAVAARRFEVGGDLERSLWYDANGRWLQSRLTYDGAAITLTLQD